MPRRRLYNSNAAKQRAYRQRLKRNARALRNGDEWGTPAWLVALARRVLGVIDLDPASNARAQQIVHANGWCSKADDGLSQPWCGRVWLNPPYSRGLVGRFTSKLISEYDDGWVTAALLLVNAATSSAWFKELLGRFPVCWLGERIAFLDDQGVAKKGNAHAQAVFYLGPDVDVFQRVFGELGTIARPERSAARLRSAAGELA